MNIKGQIICLKDKPNNNDRRVTPDEFMAWAIEDIKDGSKRALGNALGNIKKAIHCKIDEIIEKTNVPYTKDKEKVYNTKDKLGIMKKLNIRYDEVARSITDSRNIFEHNYVLPAKEDVIRDVAIAEMWLERTNEKNHFERIALILKTDKPVFDDNLKVINKCNFDYFWLPKKAIYDVRKWKEKITAYSDIEINKMLPYQTQYIKRLYDNPPLMSVDQKTIYSLYKKLLRYNLKTT